MGRFKELRDKQAAGTITDEEKAELVELQKDVDEAQSEDESEEEAVNKAADAIADKAFKGFEAKMAPFTELAEKLSKVESQEITASGSDSQKFIVDKQLGKVTVKQLEDEKVVVAQRKALGKEHTTVSMKTVHWIEAMAQNNREKLQVLTEGSAANGGYLVPEDFVNMIVEDRRDAVVMRQLATVLPVSTDTIHLPNLATRPRAFWRSEGAVKNTTTVTFGEIVLTPYSLAAIVTLSNELVADARLGGNIVNLVAGYMTRALAEEEEKAFWTGDGSGKPTGVDNYTLPIVNAAGTDTTRADGIIRATFQLGQGYRSGAAFVANRNTWAKIATLKDSQNNYLLSDLGSSASPLLRGYRTYEVNDIADGKAFFGDFSFYYIADREGIAVDTSTEATVGGQNYFERNLTGVRVEERVDGELARTDTIIEIQGLGGF